MPKRKVESTDTMQESTPKKHQKAVIAPKSAEGSYTTVQKNAISELTGITQSDKTGAAKLLKQHGWNVATAVNAYFSSSANGSTNSLRQSLNKTFDSYRDDPKNDPDEINLDGTMKLCEDLQVGLDDIGSFAFFELVQSPALGKITREGFVDGFSTANVDSLPKMRNYILQRRSQLTSDRNLLKNVYNHTFILPLEERKKAIELEQATEFWKVLFSDSGRKWETASTPWLSWWLEFLEKKWKRAVNKDLWRQTLTFAEETLKDESLGFWNEESSWPSVIDEFVEWVKTEKRDGWGDAMELE